jgi:hypothetical protein
LPASQLWQVLPQRPSAKPRILNPAFVGSRMTASHLMNGIG